MPTEPTQLYQQQLEEEKARGILWLVEWIKANPWLFLGLALALVVLLILVVPPLVRWLRKRGITKPGELPPSEHLDDTVRRDEIKKKRITILPGPNVDTEYLEASLPRQLEDLACSIERAPTSHRTRRCVVCREEKRVENYARMFYRRMESAAVLDKLGWIYYKKPKDDTLELCIEHCFFDSLRIFNEIPLPEKRFIRQVDYFDQSNVHTLLVIRMSKMPSRQDDALMQIAALDGLSVVLFATKPIPGYETIEIPTEGGE